MYIMIFFWEILSRFKYYSFILLEVGLKIPFAFGSKLIWIFFFYILAYNQVIDFQTVWVEKVSWYLKSGKEEALWNYKL